MRTLDPATEAGARALERLATERMAWMTTIDPDGQPQSSPIWFLWQGGEVLVYSHIRAHRNANIEANPRVSFNLDTASEGDEYVTMEGETRVDHAMPPSSANPDYQAKYRRLIDRYGWTPEWLAENYPIPIMIKPTRWRLGD